MSLTLRIILLLLPFLAMVSCYGKESPSVADIEKLIQQNLKPGDPADKIETFLKQNGFPYNFDAFAHRYESSVPKSESTDAKGVKSVITINIYVNEDRTFQKAEVRTVYTYL
jgi:hypothetical protein